MVHSVTGSVWLNHSNTLVNSLGSTEDLGGFTWDIFSQIDITTLSGPNVARVFMPMDDETIVHWYREPVLSLVIGVLSCEVDSAVNSSVHSVVFVVRQDLESSVNWETWHGIDNGHFNFHLP
jgi:hypothetical protein